MLAWAAAALRLESPALLATLVSALPRRRSAAGG